MATVSPTTTTTSTYDYSSIGGFGSDATKSVNGTMINKIRAAEEKSTLDPINKSIDNIALEAKKMDEIKTKISSLKNVVSYFDLYNSDNVFNQYLFDKSGTSAVYDTVDSTTLKEGTTAVNVTQIAQKDVFQSAVITDPTANPPSGDFTVKLGANTIFDSNDVANIQTLTYKELAAKIDAKDGVNASIEQVGDSSYRFIIKSTDTGTNNAITLGGSADLGFDTGNKQFNSNVISDTSAMPANGDKITINGTDGSPVYFTFDGSTSISTMVSNINDNPNFNATIDDANKIEITMSDGSDVTIDSSVTGVSFSAENTNHTLHAQNLNATVDGVAYNTSSNSITIQNNLKITAVDLGKSSVTISKDTSAVTTAAKSLVTTYNDVTDSITKELNDPKSVIGDKSALRTILSNVKAMLFENYGADTPTFGSATDEYGDTVYNHSNVTNNDKNIFGLGFSLDKTGNLSVDTDTINGIINGTDANYNFNDLKNVFTGAYENKGLGVQLNDYLGGLDGYNGLLTNYETKRDTRKTNLETDQKDEIERLDAKYQIMAEQFAAYSNLITQMESSFSGLKQMIQQSISSSN